MKDDQKQISLLKFLEPALGLLLTVFSFLTTANSKGLSPTTKIILYVVFSLVGVGALFLVYRYIRAYLNYDGNASATGAAKLKKHVKQVLKIARVNAKALNKKYPSSQDEYVMSVIKRMKKGDASLEDKQLKELNAYISISNCIKDIDHFLLSNGEYNHRVKLGRYLYNARVNLSDSMKGTIDMMGWTYALMGRKAKSKNAIMAGINELKKKEEEYKKLTDPQADMAYDIYYNLQRAYRHLAANPYIRRSDFRTSIHHLEEAQIKLDELKQARKKFKFAPHQLVEINRSQIGLDFGIVETNYDFAKSDVDKNKRLDEAKDKLVAAIVMLNKLLKNKEIEKIDPHRFANIVIIKNKIYFLAIRLKDYEAREEIKKFVDEFGANHKAANEQINLSLKEVNSALKRNVYVDQAIESFVQQRMIQMCKEVDSIYRN